jgi:hypothetical protein
MEVVSQSSVGHLIALEIHYYIALCKSISTQYSVIFTICGLDHSLSDSPWNISWSNQENKTWYSGYTPFRVLWPYVDVCEVVEGGRALFYVKPYTFYYWPTRVTMYTASRNSAPWFWYRHVSLTFHKNLNIIISYLWRCSEPDAIKRSLPLLCRLFSNDLSTELATKHRPNERR